MQDVKRSPARPFNINVSSPIWIKISWIIAAILLVLAIVASSFVAGYGLAFSKVANVYAETCVLKAKAAELEDQILRLRNTQALMAADFYIAGVDIPTVIDIVPDTVVCTLYVEPD